MRFLCLALALVTLLVTACSSLNEPRSARIADPNRFPLGDWVSLPPSSQGGKPVQVDKGWLLLGQYDVQPAEMIAVIGKDMKKSGFTLVDFAHSTNIPDLIAQGFLRSDWFVTVTAQPSGYGSFVEISLNRR